MNAQQRLATSKTRSQAKLVITRLRLTQEKETAIAKQNRREVARLLENGKVASARIRVENIIARDIYVELLEMLELYAELIQARAGMLEKVHEDVRLKEAVYSLVYAAPFTDMREMTSLREVLVRVLHKESALDAIDNRTHEVPEKIVQKTCPAVPEETLITLYMTEIARAYKVRVPGLYEPEEEEEEEEQPNDEASGETKAETKPSGPPGAGPPGAPPAKDDLLSRFNALRK